MKKISITRSSGSVFADLGLPDADEYMAKSGLAARIYLIIKRRRLSQARAAIILGVTEPEIRMLFRGLLEGNSVDQLFSFLNILGCDMQITVSAPHSRKTGKVSVMAG